MATPVLAGRAVDAIVDRRPVSTVVRLVVLIAGIALLDAGIGLWSRFRSSRLDEGLILDLRRAVLEHVQRLPVAFFTRTRIGALVSRLNNDVIGANGLHLGIVRGGHQCDLPRLTVGVMVSLSWQISAVALMPLPLFVVPALVSFERVFEVLAIDPLIKEKPEALSLSEGPSPSRSTTSTSPIRPSSKVAESWSAAATRSCWQGGGRYADLYRTQFADRRSRSRN